LTWCEMSWQNKKADIGRALRAWFSGGHPLESGNSRDRAPFLLLLLRKLLGLIVQTKIKYAKKKKEESEEDVKEGENKCETRKEIDEDETNSDRDQDSDVSFTNNTDGVMDTTEMKEEDWIDYMKRGTAIAMEHVKNARIPCWIEMYRKMK